jgi:hypothetical protein
VITVFILPSDGSSNHYYIGVGGKVGGGEGHGEPFCFEFDAGGYNCGCHVCCHQWNRQSDLKQMGNNKSIARGELEFDTMPCDEGNMSKNNRDYRFIGRK